MAIERYFTDDNLFRVKSDFGFLVDMIVSSYGEFDLAIRDNYFNIYYKGNSLAKVTPIRGNAYDVRINSKFFKDTSASTDNRFEVKAENGECNLKLDKGLVHPFFQKKHLLEFASNIKAEAYCEELVFEQSLITDNMKREDFIFIDRQITDTELKRKRLDLLALRKVNNNRYTFLVTEIKLGNNVELEEEVANQLQTYINHIKSHFIDYKNCYERQYKQKKELGLITGLIDQEIEIIEPVSGIVIVGLYSGLAAEKIKNLLGRHPEINIHTCFNDKI